MRMFGAFLGAMDNYEARKVARDEYPWGFISTAECCDGDLPYETAVEHPEYNDGDMVIVGKYATREEAVAGHATWVKTMTAENLPDSLADCANAELGQLLVGLNGGPLVYNRRRVA